MNKKFIIGIVFVLTFLTGCANFGIGANNSISTQETVINPATNNPETTTITRNVNSSNMKLITRADLAEAMCTVAGDSYEEYLVLSNTNVEFLPIVIQDGKYVNLPPEAKIKFNNTVKRPNAAPFNMGSCVEDVMKTGVERFFTGFFKDVFQFGRDVLPYGAGYLVADKFLDFVNENNKLIAENSSPKIENVGEGATVAVGTDNAQVNVDQRSDQAGDGSTYNTCAGEVVDGQCVLPAQAQTLGDVEVGSTPVVDAATCLEAGGTPLDAEDNLVGTEGAGPYVRCSNGSGGNITSF